MSAKFGGKVKLENINPPASYTITGEGNGGAMGFAKGGADVALEELGPAETLLKYNVKAQVGGKMAQLGARLIDSTAKQMADQFFDRFAAGAGVQRPPRCRGRGAERRPTETAARPRTPPAWPPTPRPQPGQPRRDRCARAPRRCTPPPAPTPSTWRDTGAPGPLTQHGAEGPSAGGGEPVYRPNPRPVDDGRAPPAAPAAADRALRPAAAVLGRLAPSWLVILALMFL